MCGMGDGARSACLGVSPFSHRRTPLPPLTPLPILSPLTPTAALKAVLALAVPGAKVVDLCVEGDKLMTE